MISSATEETPMLPLDPTLLLFLKFFVVFTCIFFWIRLAYNTLMGDYIRRRHYHTRPHGGRERPETKE